jgi:hypothetical protein
MTKVQKEIVKLYKIKYGNRFTIADDDYGTVWQLERGDGMYFWCSNELDDFKGRVQMYLGTEVTPCSE